MRKLVFLVLLLSVGCLRHVVRMTNEWRGRPIQEAVSEMGPPEQVTPNGATTLYMWRTSRSVKVRGGAWRGFSSGTAQERTCEGWFVVDTETKLISSFNERGDDC